MQCSGLELIFFSFSLRNITNLVLFNLDIICFAEVDGFVVVLVVVFVLSALVNDKVLLLHESERPGLVFVGGGDGGWREGGDLAQGMIVSVARTHRASQCLLLGQPLLDLPPVHAELERGLALVELGLGVVVVAVQHLHLELEAVAAPVPLGGLQTAARLLLLLRPGPAHQATRPGHWLQVRVLALLGWLHPALDSRGY